MPHDIDDLRLVVKASYGNDSVALIQWLREAGAKTATILYNDTGWANTGWTGRVEQMEAWARGLGFQTARTQSVGMDRLVHDRKGWPRQGIQFCTEHLKMKPTAAWLEREDPERVTVAVIGVRRCESENRRKFPEIELGRDWRWIWAPLVDHDDAMRDALLRRAGIEPLPHRSDECFPCINSNRADILRLTEDRIAEISALETDLGFTSKGKPRTMFRPYRYMGATGIREIVRWAKSERGRFSLDDGNGSEGCEAGWCGK